MAAFCEVDFFRPTRTVKLIRTSGWPYIPLSTQLGTPSTNVDHTQPGVRNHYIVRSHYAVRSHYVVRNHYIVTNYSYVIITS